MSVLNERTITLSAIGSLLAFYFWAYAKTEAPTPITHEAPVLTKEQRWERMAPENKMLSVRDRTYLKKMTWEKSGFGNVAMASFNVENKSGHLFKDLTVECNFYGKSGTIIGSRTNTIYENFPDKSDRRVKNINFGFINTQSESASCDPKNLVILD